MRERQHERGLTVKDPLSCPVSTRLPIAYLGHVVTREGFFLGRKARGRIPGHVRAASTPARLRDSVCSIGAAWMFGSRCGASMDDAAEVAAAARQAAKNKSPMGAS